MTDSTLASMCNRPVTYQRWTAAGTDDYNNPTYSHVADSSTVNVWLEQAGQPAEVLLDANIQAADWLLVDPNPDAGLTGRDRVDASGTVFEVVGADVKYDDRGPHHLEARLRLVDT